MNAKMTNKYFKCERSMSCTYKYSALRLVILYVENFFATKEANIQAAGKTRNLAPRES